MPKTIAINTILSGTARCGRGAVPALLLLALLSMAGGCNLFQYPAYVLAGGKGKKVQAAYDGLSGHTVAVLIAADPGALAMFPQAEAEIAQAVQQLIRRHVKKVRFVELAKVEKYKFDHLQWYALPLDQVGRALGADRVVYLDMYQYQMYEPGSFQLLRGQIAATVKVFEVDGARPGVPVYKGSVQALYPTGAPTAATGDTALWSVMQRTGLLFADRVAKLFYDHRTDD